MNPEPKQPFSLEGLLEAISAQKFPPVEKWHPDFCGDIDMCIKKDGSWFYMGTPIGRARMVKLFSSVLRKDSDGKTYLVTPVEKIGITVEDAHFVAIGLETGEQDGLPVLIFETNVGDKVVAGKSNPIRVETNETTDEPRPYILVRGNLEALISRSVFYQMVELASLEGEQLFIESGGERFLLGSSGATEC